MTLLPLDFETDDLAERLDPRRFQRRGTDRLHLGGSDPVPDRAGRAANDGHLGGAAPDRSLVFTFVRKDFLDGQAMYGAEPAYQDFVVKQGLMEFGLYPEEVEGFLAEFRMARMRAGRARRVCGPLP